MIEPTVTDFEAIEKAAEAAIAKAVALPNDDLRKLGAVNWGDVGVGEVLFCRNKHGDMSFVVEIGEASPGCALEGYVGLELAKAFPGRVFEVRAEW